MYGTLVTIFMIVFLYSSFYKWKRIVALHNAAEHVVMHKGVVDRAGKRFPFRQAAGFFQIVHKICSFVMCLNKIRIWKKRYFYIYMMRNPYCSFCEEAVYS